MNLPETFIENMRELLGAEYENYIESYEKPKVQGLRVNTGKIAVEDFLKITPFSLTPVPWTTNGFFYSNEDAVTKHPHYYAGLYYIQEPSAMIPASRLPIEEGDRVLDLCAAPGGKATELAARLKGTGVLVANDISNSRAKGLLKNLELFGMGNILVTSEKPEDLLKYFEGFFDKILVDAPCSGEGMFRREPAMIRDWEKRGPAYYAPIQRQIVKCAVQMLRPGGMLMYSTCTFSRLENEENISALLDQSGQLTLEHIEHGPCFSHGYLPGTVRMWPHRSPGEGHFAALLKKDVGREQSVKKGQAEKKRDVPFPRETEEFLALIPALHPVKYRREFRDNRAYLLPEDLPTIRGLRFLRTGLYLGECKKNRFEPSQALAMNLRAEDYPFCLSMSSEDPRVLRYLKGETVELVEQEEKALKGGCWVLVCVDGYSLGWAKLVNGSLRNKYYPGWRLM